MDAIKTSRDRPPRCGAERLNDGLDLPGCGGRYLPASHHIRHSRGRDRPVAHRHRLAARVRELREDLATVPVHGGHHRGQRTDGFVGVYRGLIIVVLATAVDKHVTGNDQANPEPCQLTQQPGQVRIGEVAVVNHSL